MKYLKYAVISFIFLSTLLMAEMKCEIPDNIRALLQKTSFNTLVTESKDVRRNRKALKRLCVNQIRFKEGKYNWKMILVTHPKHSKGAFWFLPHDDEDTAFDAAVYATQKYGGGFLAVMSNDKRYFIDQDPNRNFGDTVQTARTCKKQKYPAPKYSKTVFMIIDALRAREMPYMALHNNKNGWFGNDGSGGVSILTSSKTVQSYPASKSITQKDRGLKDEDSLVYIAGFEKKPDQRKLDKLLNLGLNTKYEIIDKRHNDCSLSNYVVLNKGTTNYYNIEAEHNDLRTHKKMIDRLVSLLDMKKI